LLVARVSELASKFLLLLQLLLSPGLFSDLYIRGTSSAENSKGKVK